MIQDLDFGRMENGFRDIDPSDDDKIVCFSGNNVLLNCNGGAGSALPSYSDIRKWSEAEDWKKWQGKAIRYVFRLQGIDHFIFMGDAGRPGDSAYTYEKVAAVRNFAPAVPKNVHFAIMTAWHLYVWYRANRFCGRCGAMTVHDDKERMVKCPECGNMIFPRISPAVITIVTNGDRCLLARSKTSTYKKYGAIAGFVEIGETAEETVQREVMEEVGLKVKNIRYYKSQPWGIAGNLSIGFFADLDGDDQVKLQEEELSCAEWFRRGELPGDDDGISLTREMMRLFNEGKEPK